MDNSSKNQLFPKGGNGHFYAAHWLNPIKFGQLLIQETVGKERKNVTKLIAQWVLRGSFFIIAAGDWFIDHDDLRYALFQFTNYFDELLDHRLRLVRARTCFQLLDLLERAEENKPVLILDPLHHFFNADVALSVRNRIFEQCCKRIKRLSLSNYVAVLVPKLDTDDHKRFFPILASVADEVIPVEEAAEPQVSQDVLF